MKSKRITFNFQFTVFVITQLSIIFCMLTFGCRNEDSSIQKVSSVDDNKEKKMIENILKVKLPESVRNCRYFGKDVLFGGGIGCGFFEISKNDLLYLLNTTETLPEISKFGQDSGPKDNIERAIKISGENLTWWKPSILQRRQYAHKIIENLGRPFWSRHISICIGEIHNNLMGVYLVYICDY